MKPLEMIADFRKDLQDGLIDYWNLAEFLNALEAGIRKQIAKQKAGPEPCGVGSERVRDWANVRAIINHDFGTDEDPEMEPDWSGTCENCGQSPIVPLTGMCGPCTFGDAETVGGNW